MHSQKTWRDSLAERPTSHNVADAVALFVTVALLALIWVLAA